MGQGYSKEEQRAVRKIEKVVEFGVEEDEGFDKLVRARGQLFKIVRQPGSLAFKPVVDHLKRLLKSKELSGERKF